MEIERYKEKHMQQEVDIQPLVVEQEFPVDAKRLYEAWTEEAQLKSWWKPMDASLRAVSADMRPGGTISYQFDGADFTVAGEYEKVSPGSALRYSWNWNFGSDELKNESFVLDIQFQPKGGGSVLKVRQEGFRNEEERKAHEEGWKIGLQQLQEFISR